jgi:hypothetical protein
MDAKFRMSAEQVTRKPTILQISGPSVYPYHKEFFGRKS